MTTVKAWVLVAAVIAIPACSDDDDRSGTVTVDTPQGKVTYKVDADEKNVGMTMDTPEGRISYGTKPDLTALAGLLYPGAPLVDGSNMSMSDKNGEMSSGHFSSSDAPEKVVAFYKKALPDAAVVTMGPMTSVSGKAAAGGDFSVTITPDQESGKTLVIVTLQRKK